MADNPKVKGIKYGTMQQYLHQEIDNDTLYFITDKGLLYRGSQIVVPTKFIDVDESEDNHNNKYYTFTIEAYADDPANPETLSFDVWSKAAVTTLIQSLSTSINNHAGATASNTVKGHTYLSDATDSDLNAATGGTAATPLAVKRALAAANQYTDEQIANISSGMTFKGTYGLAADNPDESRSLDLIEAAQGDMYICISTNLTGVHYHDSTGTAITNGTLDYGDQIICVQAAVESGGTVTTPARWTIVANTASNAVTTNETLTADTVILGNGNKTVKKLAAGTNGQFLRQTSHGARWSDHVNLDHGIAYAECEDLLGESHKAVEILNYVLQPYSIIAVRFAQGVKGGDDFTITDGNTTVFEQVPIIYHGGIIVDGIINKGDTATFMYVPDFLIKEHEIRALVLISVDRAPNNTPTSLSAFTNDIQGIGTCTTGYGTQQKQVTMSGVTINKGSVFAVRFSNPVGAGATMKVNQQAVKSIKHRNLDITSGQILGGDTALFISDGSYYHLLAVDRPIDTAPTAGSHNMVESNGIYNMIQSAIAESTLYWEEMQ